MFSRIWSTELTDYESETQEDGQSYLEIKKVNFFVGANNSGKSRLIRKLFSSIRIRNSIWFCNPEKNTEIRDITKPLKDILNTKELMYWYNNSIKKLVDAKIVNIGLVIRYLGEYNQLIRNALDPIPDTQPSSLDNNLRNVILQNMGEESSSDYNFYIDPNIFLPLPPNRFYLPILKSLRRISENNIFQKTTMKVRI